MSLVKAIGVLLFVPSQATDVASRRLYYKSIHPDGSNDTPLDQNDPNEQFVADVEAIDNGDGRLRIDLSALDLGVPHNGTVRFATAPVDAAGNVGDLSNQVDVPFDLEAPAPDTELVYEPAL